MPVYDSFVGRGQRGFDVAKGLLPYLVAMLCAVGVLRASGALDYALDAMRWCVDVAGHGRAVCGCAAHGLGQALLGQRRARHVD